MKKINCLIVDDEELARNLVENYANRIPHLNVGGKCAEPFEAIQFLQEQHVDIIFLDIQMPNLTGIEFLASLSKPPLIIFTTAYKEYALKSYELNVVDYLLKPFRFERFLQAVNKATKIIIYENQLTTPIPVTTSHENQKTKQHEKEYILVKSEFKIFRILYSNIIYIESMKEYVAYYTPKGRTLSLGSLKKLELDLPKDMFIRIHKSYIVNINYISALEGNRLHVVDKKLPIGSSYKDEVLKKIF